MGFIDFLAGAVKILLAAGVALFTGLGASAFLTQGETLLGTVLGIIAFVAGLYVVYERSQQRKRV